MNTKKFSLFMFAHRMFAAPTLTDKCSKTKGRLNFIDYSKNVIINLKTNNN